MNEFSTLNWISFFMNCTAILLLLLAFALPYWYVSDKTVNQRENAGLWMRCRMTGSGDCDPWRESADPPLVDLAPIQALMSVSFACAVASLIFYMLWLWRGEGCHTPWRKSCKWCRETYHRSHWKRDSPRAIRCRKMKWPAFITSFASGVLSLTAAILCIVKVLMKSEENNVTVGWCAWLTVASGILLLVQNFVISLCLYLLKRPATILEAIMESGNHDPTMDSEEAKEVHRIEAWIREQKAGLDNSSFTRDWDVPRDSSYVSRSNKSRDSIYYMGQNDVSPNGMGPYGDLSFNSNHSITSQRYARGMAHYRKKVEQANASSARFVPMYSTVFKNKVPMIPKKSASQETIEKYGLIYGFYDDTTAHVLADKYNSKYGIIGHVKRPHSRPSSHLGITSREDDMTRQDTDRHNVSRAASDTDFELAQSNYHGARRLQPLDKMFYEANPHRNGPAVPGVLPAPYRKRKHVSRRSTSSLSVNSMRSSTPHSLDTSFSSRVRTKYPDADSDESMDIPLPMLLSHGMQGLDLAGSDNYQVDNIWVVPQKDQIPQVLGKNRVHFKLQQSIQELDKIDLEGIIEEDDEV